MSIKDGCVSKKVTFDTQDELEEKIDRFTSVMSILTIQEDSHLNQKINQGKRSG